MGKGIKNGGEESRAVQRGIRLRRVKEGERKEEVKQRGREERKG